MTQIKAQNQGIKKIIIPKILNKHAINMYLNETRENNFDVLLLNANSFMRVSSKPEFMKISIKIGLRTL